MGFNKAKNSSFNSWIQENRKKGAWHSISNLSLGREFAFPHLLWKLKCETESEKERAQTKIQTDKQTQTDGQKDRRGNAEEDLWEWERESWTLFSYCFHPCLCSVMTQHWPSNDTVEEKRNPNLCVHNCTALPHHSLPTQLKNSIHTIEVEKYKK